MLRNCKCFAFPARLCHISSGIAPLPSNSAAAAAFAEKWLREPDNEKQQTVTFWTELLQDVLGVERPTEAVVLEYPVKCGGATRYIDAYLPASLVLVEQKSADVDLAASAPQSDGEVLTPYRQAERYATKLPHDRNPRCCLWLGDAEPTELKKLPHCMERVGRVKTFREASKSAPPREP